MLKTSLFEGFLPIVYPLHQVRNPFLRSSWINVKYNWFFWLNQLTSFVTFFVFILWLQTPTNNGISFFYTLRVDIEIQICISKVPNPVISISHLHWNSR